MEGLEAIAPDFIGIAIKSISLGDVAALADTNRTWRDWVDSHLNFIADEYTLPRAKSIKRLIDYSWLSANKLLKQGCKDGNMRVVQNALKKGACRITDMGYYAAKHGHLEIVDLLRDLGADDYTLTRGAVRGDQLEVLKTFDITNVLSDKYLFSLSHTTETSRVRDWFLENGRSEHFQKVDAILLLDMNEQSIIQLPERILYYALSIARNKLYRKLPYDEDVPGTEIFPKISNSYKILLYVFVKFDYLKIEEYLLNKKDESFSIKTLRYCFSHNKYVDLMMSIYGERHKNAVFATALRYERFDIVDKLYTGSNITREVFHSTLDLMSFAIRSPRIFAYMESSEWCGRLPIFKGLVQVLLRDRQKMFRFIMEKLGNSPEVLLAAMKLYYDFNPNKYNRNISIECIREIYDTFQKLTPSEDGQKYLNEFIHLMISPYTDLPFMKFLKSILPKYDLSDFDVNDFYPKVIEYLTK